MFAYVLPAEPPEDNIEKIEEIMKRAFEEYLHKGYNRSLFSRIYDLVFEEIEENLYQYQPEDSYDFGC